MKEYHKIKTVYKRDSKNNYKTLIDGEFTLPEFKYLATNTWVFTEKVDGTNIRIMWDSESKKRRFGGKTERAQIPTHLLGQLQDMFFVQRFEQLFPETSICLYGEGYGLKIQKGGKYIADATSFVLFDVKIGEWWLQRHDVEDVAFKLNVDIVPIIASGTLYDMVETTEAGFNSQWGDFIAEGIVARPKTELKTRSGGRIIAKIKHKDFQK